MDDSLAQDSSGIPPLPWTGERFIPNEGGPEIYYEHAHRYILARALLNGATVVDLASGEGYGAAWISEVAESVTGIDIDEASVLHARAQYNRRDNLNFVLGNIQSLPFASSCVDAVTCFEAIEHVENPRAMVEEVARILRPGGLMLVSTPNKAVYSDQRDYNNEYHVHEFYLPDLEILLSDYFAEWQLVGQRVVAGSLAWQLGDATDRGRSGDGIGVLVPPGFSESGVSEPPSMAEPMYVLGACRLAGTPRIRESLPGGSILVDSGEELFGLYRQEASGRDPSDDVQDEAQLQRARARLAASEEQSTLLRRRIRELDEQPATAGLSTRSTDAAARSDLLEAALLSHQVLAARLSGDLGAATEVNLRLLAELRAQQCVLAGMQLPVPTIPRREASPAPALSRLGSRLPVLPPRIRSIVRRFRRLVPWL